MGRVHHFVWAQVILSLGCWGCGGRAASNDATTGDTTPGQVPTATGSVQPLEPAAYCDRVARILCRAELACCSDRGFAVDEDACVSDRRAQSLWLEGQAKLGFDCSSESPAPEGYDATQAGACAAELTRSITSCHALRKDDPAAARVEGACAQVIRRKPATWPGPGQPCPEFRCSAPAGMVSDCVLGNDGFPNICAQAVPARRAGETCYPGCLPDLICSAARICGQPARDATACTKADQCASGYCEGGMACASPPPVADLRCQRLDDSARYQIYFEIPGTQSEIAVTARDVVWAAGPEPLGQRNALRLAPKDGSAKGSEVTLPSPIALREGEVPPVGEDGSLYFRSGDGIERLSLESGQSETFALLDAKSSREPWLTVFGFSGDSLMLVGGSCETAAKISLSSALVELHPDRVERSATGGTPRAVALVDNVLYCAVGSRIVAFDFEGLASVVREDSTIGDSSLVRSLVRFADHLYYLAGSTLFALDLGTATVNPLAPPLPPVAVSSLDAHNLQLDAARGQIYWMVEGGIAVFEPLRGTFFALEGGPAYAPTEHLESDADYLYWKTASGLFRRRKPD